MALKKSVPKLILLLLNWLKCSQEMGSLSVIYLFFNMPVGGLPVRIFPLCPHLTAKTLVVMTHSMDVLCF